MQQKNSIDKPCSRKRSPSPRTVLPKRATSPGIDPSVEADMNKVKKQVGRVLKARLYLLQQPGPNSFLIGGDSPDNKFKVIIGPQTCTCGKEAYCVHILFVMLRVFQVKENDAMLWARELKNFEVEGLFKKYHKRIATLSKQKINSNFLKTKEPAPTSALPNPLCAGGQSTHTSSSLTKEEEEVCPICLSDLVDGESMTVCKEGCENRLHHHCMAVWAEECRRRKEQLNCPLCRTIWQSRRTSSPGKPPPSGANVPNPLNVHVDDTGLPQGEVIPEEVMGMTEPWVQVMGCDAVACLFSRDWKHRESGLRVVSRKAVKILTEKKTTSSYISTKWELLRVCASILKHIISDPVYNVYLAALRAFRAIVIHAKCRNQEELTIAHQIIQPVIEKILLKCADANRRVTIISMKVLLEFVHGDHNTSSSSTTATAATTAAAVAIANDSAYVQRNVELVFACLNNRPVSTPLEQKQPPHLQPPLQPPQPQQASPPQLPQSQQQPWQWWLGRLVFLKRLFDDHRCLLLCTSPENLSRLSFPVSPRSEVDLTEFLNSLQDNAVVQLTFDDVTSQRIRSLVNFCVDGISCSHKKVHKLAVSLLVLCISVSALDSSLFSNIRAVICSLKSNVQKVLHRHLSTEAQREYDDILSILQDHQHDEVSGSTTSDATADYLDLSDRLDLSEASEADPPSSSISTPTSSPLPHRHDPPPPQPPSVPPQASPPGSSYDPNFKCMKQVEEDEQAAVATAIGRSQERPEDVIPEQLIPVDDITLVHIQPGDASEDGGDNSNKHSNGNHLSNSSNNKNVYLENVHWKKGRLLGTGAFSSCYEAMDYQSGRIMAVKQISFCRNSEEEQQRVHEVVLEEIMLLHRLKHPNIVASLGATQHTAHYNIFLELMPGGSIARLLSNFGAFREPVIESYSRQILQGLSYLHLHGTMHRDLKGANILVDSTGQIVKLSDFGTAARLMAQGTGTSEFSGQLLGTIPFMSPEVLRGEHYGRKCDVWSFGCCVIEMATGYPPWGSEHADNHLALMFKIASTTKAPPIPSSLGPALRDLILRCVEPKEADRSTSDELLRHALFRT